MRETFEQLINRLSRYEGLYWMNSETCPDKETATKAVRDYIRTSESCIPDFWRSNSANCALKEILDFDCGVTPVDEAEDFHGVPEGVWYGQKAPGVDIQCRCSVDYLFDVDWGDAKEITSDFARAKEIFSRPDETPSLRWQPTEQDYRECCGVWVGCDGIPWKCIPDDLRNLQSRDHFDRIYEDGVRIEPMPEQCVPKAEPKKESYQIKYPLLTGILE